MTYRITAEARAAYVYIRLEGRLTSGEVQQLARQVIDEYERASRPALLVDVRQLSMSVDVVTTVQLVTALPRLAKGIRAPAAIVHDDTGFDIVKFYETVATNRGYMTRIFPAVEPAVAWLGG